MRALALLPIVAMLPLLGCADEVRIQSLTPGASGTFTFSAHTNTMMTENDDGAAELIRRDWLADTLAEDRLCRAGYVVDNRQFEQPQTGLFANGGDIVYAGHCL